MHIHRTRPDDASDLKTLYFESPTHTPPREQQDMTQ